MVSIADSLAQHLCKTLAYAIVPIAEFPDNDDLEKFEAPSCTKIIARHIISAILDIVVYVPVTVLKPRCAGNSCPPERKYPRAQKIQRGILNIYWKIDP